MRGSILQGIEIVKAGNALARAALLLTLILPAAPAGASSLELVGYSGYLGEWELTAIVTDDGSTTPKGYSGPLSIKHVGLCTQDGPEEKSGKIRVIRFESRIDATLWADGVECSYHGVLSDFYTGSMDCSGRESVPLKLWLKESK
jgi:hypothetical protein